VSFEDGSLEPETVGERSTSEDVIDPNSAEEVEDDEEEFVDTIEEPTPVLHEGLRRSTRVSRPPQEWWKVNYAFLTYADIKDDHKAMEFFKKPMEKEFQNMLDFKVWEYVDTLPPGKKTVGCKWVLTVKRKPDGSLEDTGKARLVAKGYTQVEGMDYMETFAPVVKAVTLKTVFVIATSFDMETRQGDITGAYLHAKVDEEIYMEQPEGFIRYGKGGKKLFLKLLRAIYGLKQAGRQWRKALEGFLTSVGFKVGLYDRCIFHTGKFSDKSIIIIAVIVNDLLCLYFKSNERMFMDLRKVKQMFPVERPWFSITIQWDHHKEGS